jgi:sirohydrochlorin ferrochelatase
MHFQHDLLSAMQQGQELYPAITFTMAEPLGVDQRLADIVVDRIRGASDE